MTLEQQNLALRALHKLNIEIGRGTAQPRQEYDEFFAMWRSMEKRKKGGAA